MTKRHYGTKPVLGTIAVLLTAAVTLQSASALTIQRMNLGGTAPDNAVGGGTLAGVFNAAADWWEMAISDNWTVKINYKWAGLTGKLGEHTLNNQTGTQAMPGRETEGTIEFDNDKTTAWYVDKTPHKDEEWSTFTEQFMDFGGGNMVAGRVFSGGNATVTGKFDLLMVAKHEIGHALGMSAANWAYQAETAMDNDIDITMATSAMFAGSTLPTNNPSSGFNAHFKPGTMMGDPFFNKDALMLPNLPAGERRIQSQADILAMCQLSKFTMCNLNPLHVFEPSTLAVFGIGLAGLTAVRRRQTL